MSSAVREFQTFRSAMAAVRSYVQEFWMDRQCWPTWVCMCLLILLNGCSAGKDPGVAGPYPTWDDVINRWIGKPVSDLYLELGPPNLHPHELDQGMTEMVWDFSIDRMPGQADEYGLLPVYGFENCHLYFFGDAKGIVRSGKRVGCE